MAVSSEIGSIAKITGEEKAVELMGKAGFDCWDFTMSDMKGQYHWDTNTISFAGHPLETPGECIRFARKLREIGEAYGMTCNQSHAPAPTCCREIRDLLPRAIECIAEAGGTICVIHPDNNESAEKNAEMYRELLPTARQYGVKIAIENMWNWDWAEDHAVKAACSSPEDFIAHLDQVGDEMAVACLDIGHAEMRGLGTSAVDMILKLNHRIKALHIHDTNRHHDNHQIPFSMEIDFDAVVKALKQVGYDGVFTLEADQYMKDHTDDPAEGVRLLAESARRLEAMFRDA